MLRRVGVSTATAAVTWGACTMQRAYCSESAEVRVVSYNVLSPALCSPSHFYTCKEEDLAPETRLARVVSQLDAATSEPAVVCLQEVAHKWAGPLHTYFANKGYHMVYASYGGSFSNYMGVALAWDTKQYTAKDVEIARVSGTYNDWPKVAKVKPTFFSKLYAVFFGETKATPTPWQHAEWRKNEVVLARLEGPQGERFCVACYHMPCLFGSPEKVQVMNIHSQLVADKLERFAAGDPYLLVGDWNAQPDSSPYKLLTEGRLQAEHPECPSHPDGKWESKVAPLRSAYATANGKEPALTNFAESKMDPGNPFVGTLDYIFMSPQWKVAETHDLPAKVPESSYPTESEPSDHLLIAAKLRLASA
eukprot:TRINITY_DN4829_c0_g1_i4.p1 TRINITY_DN4829_c0_g1~~TRINITY_DN4829_c0_g1_i4.p1  ORF type:complete len:363 (+),score=150.39 TRINITY_DN4829_c0_g1_i4:63-1151(+)